MLTHKAVILGYARSNKKDKTKNKKAKGLNARQKRAMKIFDIKPEHQKWVITSYECNLICSKVQLPLLYFVGVAFPLTMLLAGY